MFILIIVLTSSFDRTVDEAVIFSESAIVVKYEEVTETMMSVNDDIIGEELETWIEDIILYFSEYDLCASKCLLLLFFCQYP